MRRVASQSDHQRLKRLEARLFEVEEAVTRLARKQSEWDEGRTSARPTWSETDDDLY
jgi:hypothetical protein